MYRSRLILNLHVLGTRDDSELDDGDGNRTGSVHLV